MTESTTPLLTNDQIAAEEASRKQLAAGLTARTEKFNQQAPPVTALAEKPASPLAARLAELSTPAPQPKRELSGAAHALQPLAKKATELLARFDAAKVRVTDAVAEYAVVDIRRVVNTVPPSDAIGSNWFRLRELVEASKEISSLVASSTYAGFAQLTAIITRFSTGEIVTYAAPDGKRADAIPSADAALMYFEPMVKRFENNVAAFENYLGIIARFEPLVIEDFKLAAQAPATSVETLPAALEVRERPMNYGNEYDPLNPVAPKGDDVPVVAVEGGTRIGSIRVPEWPSKRRA
jgi:hypothetical protein